MATLNRIKDDYQANEQSKQKSASNASQNSVTPSERNSLSVVDTKEHANDIKTA
jgi:hypothetical protein